jgi:uncharacterized DUF497 family protein
MGQSDPLAACTGFEWDDANVTKNWERHRVSSQEAEDVFFHDPFVLRSDPVHSKRERRYRALGKTAQDRRLFVAFTVRGTLIRVISVRDMSRKEVEEYQRHEERDS